ncbi:MAG: DUF1109 domain-containing protein [Caulobacteraceae bacterium]
MKTAELIDRLSIAPSPPARFKPGRWILAASVGGAAVAVAMLLAWLGLRPLGDAARAGSFWMKAGYGAALALSGWALAARLARPGGRAGWAPWLILAAISALAVRAVIELSAAEPGHVPSLWLGDSWTQCPWRIFALSIPILLAAVLAMRRAAPTRLALAGGAAGLFAGGVAAVIYGFYCEETAATFTLCWYSLGIALAAGLGAALGPRFLRW